MDKVGIVDAHADSAKLRKLGNFPNDNGRDSPLIGQENSLFFCGQLIFKNKDKDMGVKIQHPSEFRCS